jgi:hypothetical protein
VNTASPKVAEKSAVKRYVTCGIAAPEFELKS